MTPMQSSEISQALEYFGRCRKRVAEATVGLSEAQWRFQPAPDRWSIALILEHMVFVQDRVLGPVRELLAVAPAPSADRDPQVVDRIVLEKIPDRSMKAKGPEAVVPRGELSPAAALERVSRNYERLSEFLESTPDLRDHLLEAPPLRFLTGGAHSSMDGYQWALTLAGHDERHVRQIEEVKADPGYPRS
ncbi:MAG: DinB family protein [Bryobacteraceae bacterium]